MYQKGYIYKSYQCSELSVLNDKLIYMQHHTIHSGRGGDISRLYQSIHAAHSGNLPATVGQSNGDGAQKKIAFGLTDDCLTVASRRYHYKLLYTIPVKHMWS